MTDEGSKSLSTAWLKTIQLGSMMFLVMQNTSNVLVTRYAMTRPGDMFMATTAVVISDVIKVTFSLVVILFEHGVDVLATGNYLLANTVFQPMDCLKISIPGVIYMLQNNLLYVALSNLDTTVFQITCQLKILTTAVFSVLILRKHLSWMQWFALVLLILGVCVVQTQVFEQQEIDPTMQTNSTFSAANATYVTDASSSTSRTAPQQNAIVGLTASFTACLMSGFAGVYFEMLLKHTAPSIFMRNVQLGVIGSVFGYLAASHKDGDKIAELGFFYGYDPVVWLVIVLQSVGGLLTAVVVKYADNIQKGFAVSVSIVLTYLFSLFIFETKLSLMYFAGTAVVIISIFMYSKFVYTPLALDK